MARNVYDLQSDKWSSLGLCYFKEARNTHTHATSGALKLPKHHNNTDKRAFTYAVTRARVCGQIKPRRHFFSFKLLYMSKRGCNNTI